MGTFRTTKKSPAPVCAARGIEGCQHNRQDISAASALVTQILTRTQRLIAARHMAASLAKAGGGNVFVSVRGRDGLEIIPVNQRGNVSLIQYEGERQDVIDFPPQFALRIAAQILAAGSGPQIIPHDARRAN